jgi:5S rRNA maturation endonuclease (ribonuclease M5)
MSDKNTELSNIAAYCGGASQYRDGYKCLCPLHKDKNPSLLLSISSNNNIIATCLAGCNWKDLLTHFKDKGLMTDKTYNNSKEIITDTYIYESSIGDVVFEKQRLEPENMKDSGIKRFLYRRKLNNSNKWIYKDVIKSLPSTIPVPLFKLPRIFKANIVYLCEGEKDVKTLLKYIVDDNTTATCNHDGAGKWLPHYNTWLKSKTVIILQDNDDSGQKHTSILTENLADICKLYLVKFNSHKENTHPTKYDVSDFIKDYGYNALLEYIESNMQLVTRKGKVKELEKAEKKEKEQSNEDSNNKNNKEKAKIADYEDYVKLYESTLGELRVDIFSEAVCFHDKRKDYWEYARPALPVVRSDAETFQKIHNVKFQRPLFPDHLAKRQSELEPELLVNIPKWDGQDHIGLMAHCLNPAPEQGFTKDDFDQLISDYLCKAYKRVYDPNVRNRILILKGQQNKGKDWWIDSLLYGSQQFLQDLHLVNADKDAFLQLSEGWFLKIGEFDKTARTEVSVLKDMITKPFTHLRAPYDEGKKRRFVRCSFISASNINDILRDTTGATRYLILELDDQKPIDFNYPVRNLDFGLQILAQARHLSDVNFKCAQETEDKLAEYLNSKTPDDPFMILPQLYEEKVSEYVLTLSLEQIQQIRKTGRMTFAQAQPLIAELSKMLEIRAWTAQNILNHKRIAQKVGGNKYYYIPKSERIALGFDDQTEPGLDNTEIPF